MIKKGIIIAAGSGSRLAPLSNSLSKHLFPVYDKPMIYYSLSILLLAKIKNISLVTRNQDINLYKSIFGNGEKFGFKLHYVIQDEPKGIADALKKNIDFINYDPVCVVLGDNVIYGNNLASQLISLTKKTKKSHIFGYYVKNPKNYGIVNFDKNYNIISLEEKPKKPKSNWAVPGIYFYDKTLIKKLKKIKPSKRQELEITDVNKLYLKENKLDLTLLGRGYAWLDMGTYDSIQEANNFISAIEKRQGLKIGCIEEICFNNGWISKANMNYFINKYKNTNYGEYLNSIINR